MTKQIKNRITEIKQGKVPDGYKNTINGIFPNEWEEKKLSDLLTFKNGINAEKGKFGSGVKLISVMDILDESPITYEKIQNSINIDEDTLDNYSVTYGDILFQRSSENFEDAGKSNVYLDESHVATFSGFVIRGKKNHDYNPFYLNSLLKLSIIRKQIINLAAGSQHINIGQESLAKTNVFLPDLNEQQKIAEVLMKWDEAIILQEKLIERLEMYKKGLMQNILTPKGDWKFKLLGEVCDISTGKLDVNAMNPNGIYPFFSCSKDIYWINEYAYDCEALLIAGNGDIGDIKYYSGKFNAYQRTYVLTNFKFDIKYIMHFLDKYFEKEVCVGVQKSSMPYIKLSLLKNAKIYFNNENSIKKSTNILNSLNLNLDLHQQKLNNLKLQQKSLMQLLLTGIVRV